MELNWNDELVAKFKHVLTTNENVYVLRIKR